MMDVKHCTASPINDFEGFLHIFYCRIKNFTESFTEKLLRQVGWQGQVQNNWNSSLDVRSPDCRVLTQMYSPNLFSSRFWRVQPPSVGERWFLSLYCNNNKKTLKLDEKIELQILEKLDITCNIHLYVIRVCDVRQ